MRYPHRTRVDYLPPRVHSLHIYVDFLFFFFAHDIAGFGGHVLLVMGAIPALHRSLADGRLLHREYERDGQVLGEIGEGRRRGEAIAHSGRRDTSALSVYLFLFRAR